MIKILFLLLISVQSFAQVVASKVVPYDVIAVIGNSVARGNSSAVGNTPHFNSTFQWDAGNSNLRQITNLDLLEPVAASAIGSQWPQFGESYYEQMNGNRKAVIVNCAIGGSRWWDDVAGFSWYTNDNLYSSAVTKINNALAYVKVPRLTAVYIELGINDAAQDSYSLSSTFLTSLIDRINTDFGTPRILISMPAKLNLASLTEYQRISTMREMIKALSFTYANVELAGSSPMNFAAWSAAEFFLDDYHLNANANNLYGDKLANQMAIPSTSYHKYTRSLIGNLYDRTTVIRRGYIDDFVNDLDGAGLLTELDHLLILSDIGGDDNNGHVDWAFLAPTTPVAGAGSPPNMTIDGLELDGLNSLSGGALSVMSNKAVINSDAILGVYTGSYNDTPVATTGTLMGLRESATGPIWLFRQTTASSISMWGGGATASTDATDTKFQINTHYAIARASGNQSFIKNTTVVRTDAIAAVTPNATVVRGYRAGVYNSNGTLSDFLDAEYKVIYLAKYSTWNVSTFNTILTDFLTNWMQ